MNFLRFHTQLHTLFPNHALCLYAQGNIMRMLLLLLLLLHMRTHLQVG